MYTGARNDVEYSRRRLDLILSRRRLIFNPYTVSDKRLMEIVEQGSWGDEYDVTQIVTLTFTRLRERNDWRRFDGIFFRVGNDTSEGLLPKSALLYPITANDTLKQERSVIGKKTIRNEADIEALVDKTVFVSMTVKGHDLHANNRAAYRMHRLWGKEKKDANTVRAAMIRAKIEMLERIIANPQSSEFLDCIKGLFDYESRIRHAIEVIKRYSETRIPEEISD